MHSQKSTLKLTRFAAALLAVPMIFAPALMSAQAASTTTTTPAATMPPKPVPHRRVIPPKVVPPAPTTTQPTQPGSTTTQTQTAAQPAKTGATPAVATPAQATATLPAPTATTTTTTAQPVATTPAAKTVVQPAAYKTPVPSAPARTNPVTASSGTLTWGNVIYTPNGCVHNGTKAICTFTLANRGNAATLQAAYQMYTMQFVDDAHVPHASDAAYFVDNYGTRQAQLVVNSGDSGTLIREYPNVDERVATGEFHLADQIVGGVGVGAAGTIPQQGSAVANGTAPAQPGQPGATDPTSKVQQGVNQVNDTKQKATSLWQQIKAIKH